MGYESLIFKISDLLLWKKILLLACDKESALAYICVQKILPFSIFWWEVFSTINNALADSLSLLFFKKKLNVSPRHFVISLWAICQARYFYHVCFTYVAYFESLNIFLALFSTDTKFK